MYFHLFLFTLYTFKTWKPYCPCSELCTPPIIFGKKKKRSAGFITAKDGLPFWLDFLKVRHVHLCLVSSSVDELHFRAFVS